VAIVKCNKLDGDVLHWSTRRGEVLDQLRQISERLSADYEWDSADAAVYVLTAITPRVAAIRRDLQLKFPLPARSKIVLTVDPTAHLARSRLPTRTYDAANSAAYVDRRQSMRSWRYSRFGIRECHCANRWTPGIQKRYQHQYRFPCVFKRDCELALQSLADLHPQRRKG